MDSQRSRIHKPNARIDVLFPEWRSEKVLFDIIETSGVPETEEEVLPLDQPLLLTKTKPPVWRDDDLKKLL